jgi:hypothetical protein
VKNENDFHFRRRVTMNRPVLKLLILLTGVLMLSCFPLKLIASEETVEISVTQFNLMIETMRNLQEEVHQLKGRLDRVESSPTAKQPSLDSIPDEPVVQQSIGDELIFGDQTQTRQTLPREGEVIQLEARQTDQNSFLRRFQNMNPDISVLGDFNGTMTTRSFDPDRNKFNLREVELGFQANVDPYARADFFLGLHQHSHANIWDRLHHGHDHEEHGHEEHDHGDLHAEEDSHGYAMDIEEAYITLLALPGGFQSKVGKFYNAFGVLNRVHTPELPQFDRPNVLTNFFGHDALSEAGINVSKILPTPWYSQLEFEFTNGQNDILFGHNKITKPLMIGHLSNFFDITPNSSLRLGLSGAFGARDKDPGSGRYTGMQGADLTFFWLPAGRNQTFKWQTEVMATQLEGPNEGKGNFWGMYSFAEYQLSQRWSTGIRFDYSQVPMAPEVKEFAISPYVNFWQSEFARLRLQYKHTFRNFDLSSDQFFLQYTFMLGTHKAHSL